MDHWHPGLQPRPPLCGLYLHHLHRPAGTHHLFTLCGTRKAGDIFLLKYFFIEAGLPPVDNQTPSRDSAGAPQRSYRAQGCRLYRRGTYLEPGQLTQTQ